MREPFTFQPIRSREVPDSTLAGMAPRAVPFMMADEEAVDAADAADDVGMLEGRFRSVIV